MGIKKSLIFSTILVIVLLVSIPLISCGPAAGPSGEGDPQSGEELTQEEIADFEEAIEEEIIEVVDYDNALIGAELYGYMPSYLCTNSDNYIKVTVTNTSDFTWRTSGSSMVRLSYHYWGQDVDFAEYDKNIRTVLPNNLEPGESATVEVLINDITNPGTYKVEIDLVLEGHFWFSSKEVQMVEGFVFFESCGSGQ